MEIFSAIESMPRTRQKFFGEIRRGVGLDVKIRGMLVTSAGDTIEMGVSTTKDGNMRVQYQRIQQAEA